MFSFETDQELSKLVILVQMFHGLFSPQLMDDHVVLVQIGQDSNLLLFGHDGLSTQDCLRLRHSNANRRMNK